MSPEGGARPANDGAEEDSLTPEQRRLAESARHLVASRAQAVSHRFGRKVDETELVSVGTVALCEAARTWTRDRPFEEYAGRFVWRAMMRATEAEGVHASAVQAATVAMLDYHLNAGTEAASDAAWAEDAEVRRRHRGFSNNMAQAAATAAIEAVQRLASAEDELAEREEYARAMAVLKEGLWHMTPPERQALELLYARGMTLEKAGAAAQAASKTVWRREEAGIAKLRKSFELEGIKRMPKVVDGVVEEGEVWKGPGGEGERGGR